MIETIFLIFLVVFFAVNMGASGIAPAFAATVASNMTNRKRAVFLFAIFVIIGALVLGRNVSMTLGKSLIPKDILNFSVVVVIIASASLSLFLANILKIPQSTSQVTVGSITGVGLYFKQLYWKTLLIKIIPVWIILPLLSFFLTFLLYRKIYPPQQDKLHIYERIFCNEKKIKLVSIFVSCYVAFSIGSNNVANAVGPLFGAGIVDAIFGLLLVSPLFGIGAYFLGKGNLETTGKQIIPLGILSSTLVSFVTATLLLIASFMGIPQSLVQLNVFSIFAISCVKDGHQATFDLSITKKTIFIWAITPLLSLVISYFLLILIKG